MQDLGGGNQNVWRSSGKKLRGGSLGDPEDGWTAFDYAQHNEMLKGTDAYWLLNDAHY